MKTRLPFRSVAIGCATAAVLLAGCQNVPKYKRSNGHFDEWGSYEGKNFHPSRAIDTIVDVAGNTITIGSADNAKVLTVVPETKIFHNGDVITLAELPANQEIRYTTEADRKTLATVWYGTHTNASLGGVGSAHHH